jgi:hypothetical protein
LIFNLAFFHSFAGLGCGVDGGDDSEATPSAMLRVLFFPASVFTLLDGDAFILQVTGVFTCILSGATLVVDGGGVYRSILLRGGGGRSSEGESSGADLFKWLLLRGMKKPKGLNTYL